MKKTVLVLLSILVVLLPIIVVGIVYLTKETNFLNKSNFWYGYMSYFGTVALAAVSLWQNENANLINKRLADMTCKDKLAYIVPTRSQIIRRNIFEFRFTKRGNSFGFFVSYFLYIDGEMVSYKSLNDFYEEANIDITYEKNIDLSEHKLSNTTQITMVVLWQNQYGFKYFENIHFNFVAQRERSDYLVSDINTIEIKYEEYKNNG